MKFRIVHACTRGFSTSEATSCGARSFGLARGKPAKARCFEHSFLTLASSIFSKRTPSVSSRFGPSRGGANLLGGRALTRTLFPLVWPEYGSTQLKHVLSIGSLPGIVDSVEAREDLSAYVGHYLTEEIRAEALARSIEAFSRFLTMAAQANGQQLNFTKIGGDAQVPPRTVREFFNVLIDTLVGYEVPPFRELASRKAVATSKFFFFDIGVAHALQGVTEIVPGTSAYGHALEHLVANGRAYLSYRRRPETLSFYRTTSQLEVDFLIGGRIGIEVKGAGRVSDRDTRALIALAEDVKLTRKIVVCTENAGRRLASGVEVMPIREFLDALWSDELLKSL